MFGSYETKFQPSGAKYLPLSTNSFDHDNQIGVNGHVEPGTEEACGDKSSPSFTTRLFFVLLGTLVAALVLGLVTDVLSSVNGNQTRIEEGRLSGVKTKQFAPQIPTTTIVFSEKQALMEPPNDQSKKAWDALIPIGRGFVNISDFEAYGLEPGIPTASGVDRFSVAMFHQLHCLTALRESYWQLMDAMAEDWTDAARQAERARQIRAKHAQHCFAYIAESIWCSADLTIEWAQVQKNGDRRQVDGWGIPHQCKDPDAVLAWVQANHGPTTQEDHVHHFEGH